MQTEKQCAGGERQDILGGFAKRHIEREIGGVCIYVSRTISFVVSNDSKNCLGFISISVHYYLIVRMVVSKHRYRLVGDGYRWIER